MKTFSILAAVAAAGLSVSAVAQDDGEENRQQASGNQAEQQEVAQAEEEIDEGLQEVVCKTEPILGSRTRVTRTCMTRQEWNYTRERTRREMDNRTRAASSADNNGLGSPFRNNGF